MQLLPPDINTSEVEFAIGRNSFGLSAIKSVGVAAIESIIAAALVDSLSVCLILFIGGRGKVNKT